MLRAHKYTSKLTANVSHCLHESHQELRRGNSAPWHVKKNTRSGRKKKKMAKRRKMIEDEIALGKWLNIYHICASHLRANASLPHSTLLLLCRHSPCHFARFNATLLPLTLLALHLKQIDNFIPVPLVSPSVVRFARIKIPVVSACGWCHRLFIYSRDYTFVFCLMWLRAIFPLFASNTSDVPITA